jgi:hypothetical protein
MTGEPTDAPRIAAADLLAEQHGAGRLSVVHRPGKEGLDRAYVDGTQRAMADGAEFVIQMDSDLSIRPGASRRCSARIVSARRK